MGAAPSGNLRPCLSPVAGDSGSAQSPCSPCQDADPEQGQCRAGETAQWANCLPFKQENLSLDPQSLRKKARCNRERYCH